MSYNGEPKWTDQVTLPDPALMKCPWCNTVACNVEEAMEPLLEAGYYEPRHIPPELVFVCGNPDCPHCDEEFTYKLTAIITASPKAVEVTP